MDPHEGTGDRDNERGKKSPAKKPDNDMSQPVQGTTTIETWTATSDSQTVQSFPARTNEDRELTNSSQPSVDYENEANRLASFVGHWPADAVISASELARAGLFYTGPDDRVKCAYCRGRLYNWTEGDSAIGEHYRHFPKCQFIKSKVLEEPFPSVTPSQQNMYDTCSQILIAMGVSERLLQKAMRRLIHSKVEVSVENLLDVVYELENEEEAQARDGEDRRENLFQMTENENTAKDATKYPGSGGHRLSSEDQEKVYEKNLRGKEKIVLRGRGECVYCRGEQRSWAEGDTAKTECVRMLQYCQFLLNQVAELSNIPPQELKPSRSINSGQDKVSDTAKQIVIDMGYSEELVHRAMERLTPSGEQVSVNKLLDIVFELENEEEGRVLCKICMDAEVRILFLPCRHLVCCEDCSSAVEHCPMCRTQIVGTVNTCLT